MFHKTRQHASDDGDSPLRNTPSGMGRSDRLKGRRRGWWPSRPFQPVQTNDRPDRDNDRNDDWPHVGPADLRGGPEPKDARTARRLTMRRPARSRRAGRARHSSGLGAAARRRRSGPGRLTVASARGHRVWSAARTLDCVEPRADPLERGFMARGRLRDVEQSTDEDGALCPTCDARLRQKSDELAATLLEETSRLGQRTRHRGTPGGPSRRASRSLISSSDTSCRSTTFLT